MVNDHHLLSTAALAAGLVVVTAASAGGTDKSKTTNKSSTAPTAAAHADGKALASLPGDCDAMAYVDVAGIAKSAPIKKNDDAIRDGVRDMVNTMGNDRWAGATRAAKATLSKLSQQGLSWKDVKEVGACSTPNGQELVTLSGAFEGDLVKKLIKAGKPNGKGQKASITSVLQDGRTYAAIEAEGRRYFAYETSPGVLGIATDTKVLGTDVKKGGNTAEKADLVDRHLAMFKTKLDDGRWMTTTLTPLENAHALTTVFTKKGAFDPTKDKQAYDIKTQAWAARVADTPLASMADAIRASKVSVTNDEVRVRTVVANAALNDAVERASNSSKNDWSALFRGLDKGDAPKAIGGGPAQKNK